MQYTTRIQGIIRSRAIQLGLTLRAVVSRYTSQFPGLANTSANRKKKRNSVALLWDGNTKDPHLSVFVRLVEALGGQVFIRWMVDGEEGDKEEEVPLKSVELDCTVLQNEQNTHTPEA